MINHLIRLFHKIPPAPPQLIIFLNNFFVLFVILLSMLKHEQHRQKTKNLTTMIYKTWAGHMLNKCATEETWRMTFLSVDTVKGILVKMKILPLESCHCCLSLQSAVCLIWVNVYMCFKFIQNYKLKNISIERMKQITIIFKVKFFIN